MSAVSDFHLPGPLGSLEAYTEIITQIPVLSFEEEQRLARHLIANGDLDAARQLVVSQLRFVVRVARGYSGYGLALGDLVQEGNIGLMKAVKRFDPDVGVRLVSFAVHWIRAEMHEFIIRNWRIVKVATTKAQRKLFFNLRSQKKRLGWLNRAEVDAIAKDLNVDAADVLLMEERLSAHDPAFDGGSNSDDTDHELSPNNFIEDHRFEPARHLDSLEAAANDHQNLHHALACLDDRSRDIVFSRWLTEPKATLNELAGKYAVSAERVRQIEQSAFSKLRQRFVDLPLLPNDT